MKPGSESSESGAALLSVLMIVAAMSVAAVTALDALARTVSVSRAGQFRAEAMWAVRSAEALGASYLVEVVDQTAGRVLANAPQFKEPQVFSTPRFSVSASMKIGGNCFNLNALSIGNEGESDAVNETEYENYLVMLRAAGFFEGEAQKLADSLADWIDSDDISRPNGAESSYYGSLDEPYRSGGQMLENMSELNAISGYTAEIQEKLADLICVYPTTSQNKLNINAMLPEQASLLHALFSHELSLESARGVLELRPVTGWLNTEEFLAIDEIQSIADHARNLENIGVTTEYFEMKVDLISLDQSAFGDYLFEALPDEGVKTLWRREGGQR